MLGKVQIQLATVMAWMKQVLQMAMVQTLQGQDPIMRAAVRNGVPADLRTFAAVTGLRSYLSTAPNDAVETILSQAAIPDNVMVAFRTEL